MENEMGGAVAQWNKFVFRISDLYSLHGLYIQYVNTHFTDSPNTLEVILTQFVYEVAS